MNETVCQFTWYDNRLDDLLGLDDHGVVNASGLDGVLRAIITPDRGDTSALIQYPDVEEVIGTRLNTEANVGYGA